MATFANIKKMIVSKGVSDADVSAACADLFDKAFRGARSSTVASLLLDNRPHLAPEVMRNWLVKATAVDDGPTPMEWLKGKSPRGWFLETFRELSVNPVKRQSEADVLILMLEYDLAAIESRRQFVYARDTWQYVASNFISSVADEVDIDRFMRSAVGSIRSSVRRNPVLNAYVRRLSGSGAHARPDTVAKRIMALLRPGEDAEIRDIMDSVRPLAFESFSANGCDTPVVGGHAQDRYRLDVLDRLSFRMPQKLFDSVHNRLKSDDPASASALLISRERSAMKAAIEEDPATIKPSVQPPRVI